MNCQPNNHIGFALGKIHVTEQASGFQLADAYKCHILYKSLRANIDMTIF